MPYVPLLSTQAAPQLPGGVLDRERRPNVDVSAILQGQANLGAANKGVLVDAQPFVEAAGAPARAVAQVGSVIAATMQKRQEVNEHTALLQAQGDMDATAAELGAFYDKNQTNTAAWMPEAQKRTDAVLKKYVDDPRFTQAGRQRLQLMASTWQRKTVAHADSFGTQTDFRTGSAAAQQRADLMYDNGDQAGGDAILDTAHQMGLIYDFQRDALKTNGQKVVAAKQEKSITGQIMQRAAVGDTTELDSLLGQLSKVHGIEEWEVKLKRQQAVKMADDFKVTAENRNNAAFVGNFAMARAQGGTFDNAFFEKAVENGQIKPHVAAELMEANKRVVGADRDAFEDVITQAMKYDPEKDAANQFKESFDLQTKAALLSPNEAQWHRFNAAMSLASTANRKAETREETTLRAAMRESISAITREASKRVDDGTAAFMQAVKNPDYVKALGLTADAQQQLAGTVSHWFSKDTTDAAKIIDGPAALDLFKKAMTDKNRTLDAAKYNALPASVKQLFDDAQHGKLVKKLDDADAAARANFNGADTMNEFEDWFAQQKALRNGKPPTADEANKWLHGKTSGMRMGNFWDISQPKAAAKGDVSIRGFQDAADLADKLPEALQPYAANFVAAGRKYDLDPYALAAISIHETDHGTSKAFRTKQNAMGSSDDSGPLTFATVPESIERQAKALAGPAYKGASTLNQVAKVYAPIGAANDQRGLNESWPAGVLIHYRKLRQ